MKAEAGNIRPDRLPPPDEQQGDTALYLIRSGFKFGDRTVNWRQTRDGRTLTLRECQMPPGWHLLYGDDSVDIAKAKSYGLIVEPTGRAHVYFHEGRCMLWAQADGTIVMLNSGLYFIEPSRPAAYVTVEASLVEEYGQILVSKVASLDPRVVGNVKGSAWLPALTSSSSSSSSEDRTMTVTSSTFADLSMSFPLITEVVVGQTRPITEWLKTHPAPPSLSSSSSSSSSSSAPATVENVADALHNLTLEPENAKQAAAKWAKTMATAVYGEAAKEHVAALEEYATKKQEGKPTPKDALPTTYFAGGPEWNDMVMTLSGEKWSGIMMTLPECARMYINNVDLEGKPRGPGTAPKMTSNEVYNRDILRLRYFVDNHMKETFGIRINEAKADVKNLVSAADAELLRLSAAAAKATGRAGFNEAEGRAKAVVNTLKEKLGANYSCFMQLWRSYALLYYNLFVWFPRSPSPSPSAASHLATTTTTTPATALALAKPDVTMSEKK